MNLDIVRYWTLSYTECYYRVQKLYFPLFSLSDLKKQEGKSMQLVH